MSKPKAPTLRDIHAVRDTCLSLHLQRAARAVARRFDEAFRPLGITSGQYSLLMALARPDPWTMGELAALLAMDRTTLTANLKPLERRGLAIVAADEADRRAKRITITDQGRKLLAQAWPVWRRTQRQMEKILAATDPETMREGLRALS
jgi:DNA-binding MarR family transcriptional regulator